MSFERPTDSHRRKPLPSFPSDGLVGPRCRREYPVQEGVDGGEGRGPTSFGTGEGRRDLQQVDLCQNERVGRLGVSDDL